MLWGFFVAIYVHFKLITNIWDKYATIWLENYFLGCNDEMLGTLDPQLSFVDAIFPLDMGF